MEDVYCLYSGLFIAEFSRLSCGRVFVCTAMSLLVDSGEGTCWMRKPCFVGEDILNPLCSPFIKGFAGLGPTSSIVGPSDTGSSSSRISSCAVASAGEPIEEDKLFTDAARAKGLKIGEVPRKLGEGERKYGSLSKS